MLTVKQRVQIFNFIRDIPYNLSNSIDDSSCESKTKILGELLAKTGLECRVAQCFFRWENMPLPKKLFKKLISQTDKHTFLRVFIPERKIWVSVDPTWDQQLKNIFPISHWDGLTNTILAVTTKKFWEIKNQSGKFTNPFELSFGSFDKHNKFISGFNIWLEKIRSKNI
jgi:hypothetical protein